MTPSKEERPRILRVFFKIDKLIHSIWEEIDCQRKAFKTEAEKVEKAEVVAKEGGGGGGTEVGTGESAKDGGAGS